MEGLLFFLIMYLVLVFISFLGGIGFVSVGIVMLFKAKQIQGTSDSLYKCNKKSEVIVTVIGAAMLAFVLINAAIPFTRPLLFSLLKFGG